VLLYQSFVVWGDIREIKSEAAQPVVRTALVQWVAWFPKQKKRLICSTNHMHPEIAKRWESLENRRHVMVERVRVLSPELRSRAPNARSFSPVQVVMHMALAERWQGDFLKKNPPSALRGRKPKPTFFFRQMIVMMTRAKTRIPVAPVGSPVTKITLEEAESAWQTERENLTHYFAQVEQPDDAMVQFPFFMGLVSSTDYLDLLAAHHTYHEVWFPG
jgi:hypothetical protein